MSREVRIERAEAVTTLRISRPERANALNAGAVDEMLDAVHRAAADGTRLLVLRGEGKSFCSGFDLGAVDVETEGDLALRFIRIEQLLQTLYYYPIESVALAQGRVVGAGADIFCACAHRVCAPGTTFRFPGVRFGAVLGTRRLAQRVGADVAGATILQGRGLSATDAVACGLASQERPESEWQALVAELLKGTSCNPPATAACILTALRPDTRDADMASLVQSVSEPGFKDRIRAYRNQVMKRS
jgi:enoyl-CoA hydratase